MNTGIENIKKVVWTFEGFVKNLSLNRGKKVLEVCGYLQDDRGTILTACHIAKQEIEYLFNNDKQIIIESYFKEMTDLHAIFLDWYKNDLEEIGLVNQVNIELIPIFEIYRELKKYSKKGIEASHQITYLKTRRPRLEVTCDFDFTTNTFTGIRFNAIHNFELLKNQRLENLSIKKKGFIHERRVNELQTSDSDLKLFLTQWLKSEIDWINKQYSKNISFSENIEIDKYNDYINEKLSSIDKPKTEPIEIKKTGLVKATPVTHLKDLFKDKTHYQKIIDILIQEELIEKGTLIWKDETNGRNKFVAGLIKVLYNKGYLKRSAKNAEIPAISFNTFQVELSQSIAEKTKVNDTDVNYKFIPIITELQ